MRRRRRYIDHVGYVRVFSPTHPRASRYGYVYEHVLVMEKALGRLVRPGEHIHHRNENKADNRIENLALVSDSGHKREHAGWENIEGQWFKPCSGMLCAGKLLPVTERFFLFRTRKGRRVPLSRCRACQAEAKRRSRKQEKNS